jgi:integrase
MKRHVGLHIDPVGSHETDPFYKVLDDAMKTRSGMFDSLILAFMVETGLQPSEIVLVEQQTETGVKYFYAKKKDLE